MSDYRDPQSLDELQAAIEYWAKASCQMRRLTVVLAISSMIFASMIFASLSIGVVLGGFFADCHTDATQEEIYE